MYSILQLNSQIPTSFQLKTITSHQVGEKFPENIRTTRKRKLANLFQKLGASGAGTRAPGWGEGEE